MDRPAIPTVVLCMVFAGIGLVLCAASVVLKYRPALDYYIALDGIYFSERSLRGGGRVLYVSYYAEIAESVEVYLVAEADGETSAKNSGHRSVVGERWKTLQFVGELTLRNDLFPQLPSTLEKHDEILLVKQDDRLPAGAGSEIDLYRFVDESGVDIRVYLSIESLEYDPR